MIGIGCLVGHWLKVELVRGVDLVIHHEHDVRWVALEDACDPRHPNMMDIEQWLALSGCRCPASQIKPWRRSA